MKILRRFYTSILLAACLSGGVMALPEGANVTHGQVQISTSGNTQTIVQGSNQAIVNWNGFNIDVGELVHFIQPSSISAILNRVVGQDPSVILGSLRANGQVFLINPNGVVFGESARVDVGSLVVSTLGMSDQDFLDGTLHFEQASDHELASVINHGTITINDNGFLVLTGPMVANEGVILAKVGQVALAGGTKSTVSFDPTGMIQVELPSDSLSQDGIVSLSHGDVSDVLSNVVNSGAAPAGQLVVRGGRSYLEVASGTVVNTGEIRAEGQAGEDGGRIVLDSTANTLLAEGSVLSAAGSGADSSGGEVYVLSDGQGNSVLGSLIDVSGGSSGDGGFAEQSSGFGRVAAEVKLSAENGDAGTFLIDPERILVESGAGGSVQPMPGLVLISEFSIEGTLAGTVVLQTEDGVDFEGLVGGDLTLQPDVNLTIDLTSAGGDGFDAISFSNPSDTVTLSGSGAFTYTSLTGTDVRDLDVVTDSGDINLTFTNGGSLASGNSFTSTSGDVSITGAQGTVQISTGGNASVSSVGTTTLTGTNVASFTGTGLNFALSGTNRASSDFDFVILGDLSGPGQLEAPDVSIQASTVGQNFQLEFDTNNFTATANLINLDSRAIAFAGNSITVTNNSGNTLIRDLGEGTILSDNGTSLNVSPFGADLSYTTTGDRSISRVFNFGGDTTIVTDGALTASGIMWEGDTLNLTGASINLDGSSLFSPFSRFQLTATTGDIILVDRSEAPSSVEVDTNTTGLADITVMRDLANSDLVAGTSLTLNAPSITANFNAPIVNATSTTGAISLDHTGAPRDVSVSAVAAGGSADVSVHVMGNMATRDIQGGVVNLSTSGVGPRNITNESDRIVGNTSILLNTLGSVNANTTTNQLTVFSNGDTTIDNQAIGGNPLAVTLNALTGSTVTLVTDSALAAGNTYSAAGTINLTGTSVAGDVTASGLNAVATTGDVNLGLLVNPTTVDATASMGSVTLSSNQNITVGSSISAGNTVSINNTGGTLSGSGTIDAPTVDLASDSIQVNLGTSVSSVTSSSTGDTTLVGSSPSLNVIASSSGGQVNASNSGVLDASMGGGVSGTSVTLNGSTVLGEVTASSVSATATTGDADLLLLAPATVTGSATMGTFFVTTFDSLQLGATGLAANTIDIVVTGASLSGPGLLNASTILLDASTIDVDLGSQASSLTSTSVGNTVVDANSASLSLNASTGAGGDLTVDNVGGAINLGTVSGEQVTLQASGDISGQGVVTGLTGTSLTGANVTANVQSPSVVAVATSGDVALSLQGGLLSGSASNRFSTSSLGNLQTGQITANEIDLSANGPRQNPFASITRSSGTLSAPTVTLNADSIDVQTQAQTVNVPSSTFLSINNAGDFQLTATTAVLDVMTSSGSATVNTTPRFSFLDLNANVAQDLNLTNSTGDILVHNVTAGGEVSLTATNGDVRHNVEIPGQVNATGVTVSATNTSLDVNAQSVNSTTTGNSSIRNVGSSSLSVSGSAGGDFGVTSSPGISHGNISGANVFLNASPTGNISRNSGTITSPGTITLQGQNVTAQTDAGAITVTAGNDADISNLSNSVDPVSITAGNDLSFTSSGAANISQLQSSNNLTLDVGQAVTGSFQGNRVSLAGTSVNASVDANELTATARSGDATITSNSTNTLTLSSSSASGDFSVSHQGDLQFDRIEAQNVNLSTTGNITDTANTIVASGITLSGNNILVNTEGRIIVISAQGNVTVSNSSVDLESLTIDAQGNVDFGTSGNLIINQVAGGESVDLTAGANILALPDAFVSATDVILTAGGSITPDLNAPLNVQAANSITVNAPGANFLGQGGGSSPDIAAALMGSVPSSSVIIGSGSGPIYYNGVLLNPTIVPSLPPNLVVPPPAVTDQIGQQSGEVIDDGSVGSAANDGLVEQSPTQKLVAQLTETSGAGGSGKPIETSVLITLEVDALGEVQVQMSEPSPFDAAIDESEDMRADDVLDLETGELVDVKVNLYYDSTNDQLVMAVDLRADDIIDLDVSEYQLIPVKIDYSFLSDPNLTLDKLRADDIIDLDVEDLGNIPIRIHVEGNRSASE